jgi:DNA-binding transcriptional LysR family regulator
VRDLDSLLMFATVASCGSFSAATRTTGIPKATLSRRIKQLEEDLGVRLLQRNSQSIALTEAGRAFHEHCVRIASEVELAKAAMADLNGAPRGVLRVSAPYTAARGIVLPMLADFMVRYPQVRVALTLRNDAQDLVSQQDDLVIATNFADSTQASRLLLRGSSHLYASPAYLRRRKAPDTPADLARHQLLAYTMAPGGAPPVWRLRADDRRESVSIAPTLASNDLGPLHAAALAARGILLAPDPFVVEDVEAGRLMRVLDRWSGPDVELRAVFGSRRGLMPKVRVFIDSLLECCRQLPYWTVPSGDAAAAAPGAALTAAPASDPSGALTAVGQVLDPV